MKQEISALMDGELFEDEVDDVLDRVRNNQAARKNWAAYHLIGDVLRQPDHIHCDLSAKVRERMRNEPTILVPRGSVAKERARSVLLSAVASLAALGVVAWMSLQVGREAPTPQMAIRLDQIRPAKAEMKPRTSDYLMAHQEFSPSTDVSGGAYYIRTVSFGVETDQAE